MVVPAPGADLDRPAVVGHDAVNDGQAEAGALRRSGRETAGRCRRALLGGNAHALVLHREHDGSSVEAGETSDREQQPAALGHRARRPLVARFQTICRIWFSSASNQTGRRHVDVDGVVSRSSALLRSSSAVSLSTRARRAARSRTAAAARRPGTTMVVVQALRLAQHDVHQLRLLVAERQLLRSIWIEPDIDASGLRISWAMPAAISPTAASRCCRRASRSSRFLMSVTSWKVNR